MKIIFLILTIFLLSCSSEEQEVQIPKDIIVQNEFINILNDIHLADAEFELLKGKDMDQALFQRTNQYQEVYKKFDITENDFKSTILYYSKHPDKLNTIYKEVSKKLNKERVNLDQQ